MRRELVLCVRCAYALDGMGGPSKFKNMQCRSLGEHQSDPAHNAVVKSSALVVERIQGILRKLPSVGLKVLGGFVVCRKRRRANSLCTRLEVLATRVRCKLFSQLRCFPKPYHL